VTQRARDEEKLAAGGIILQRNGEGDRCVLLVHRPAYHDWSFPKGKLGPLESLEGAAVREVAEETGLSCVVLKEVAVSRYNYHTRSGKLRPKAVHYFLMQPLTAHLRRHQDDEIDAIEWVPVKEALDRLSYDQDRLALLEVLRDEAPAEGS
jgi:8-oxo-dGTP diphosphatase